MGKEYQYPKAVFDFIPKGEPMWPGKNATTDMVRVWPNGVKLDRDDIPDTMTKHHSKLMSLRFFASIVEQGRKIEPSKPLVVEAETLDISALTVEDLLALVQKASGAKVEAKVPVKVPVKVRKVGRPSTETLKRERDEAIAQLAAFQNMA